MTRAYDVLSVGEVLVELSSSGPLVESAQLRLSFSGDALNAAAAAAAAGASVGLVARVGDDELGDALATHVESLGVDASLLRRVPFPNGVYFTAADSDGTFVYVRRGSAGSTLEPADVEAAARRTRSLLVSGVGQAISMCAAAAVQRAAELVAAAGGTVVYDPNFRPRLTSPEAARAALARMAPLAALVTPSFPAEASALLGADDPAEAAAACRRLGARAAAVTCGEHGVVLDDGSGPVHVPAAPAPAIVDATGAGDVLAGTVAARLALGDDLETAVRLGAAAAAQSLGGRGGTGHLTAGATRFGMGALADAEIRAVPDRPDQPSELGRRGSTRA